MTDHVTDAVRQSGQSQAALADLLGMSPNALSDRMRGRTRWTVDEVVRLAKHFRLSTDELICGPDVETFAGVTR